MTTLIKTLYDGDLSVSGAWPFPQPKIPDDMVNETSVIEVPEGIIEIARGFGWDDSEIEELNEGGSMAWEALADQMVNSGKSGWIVAVETPVFSARGSYSWGHTWTGVFFGATIDDALKLATDWAEERSKQREAERA